jgi:hypothetical protein
VLRFLKLKKMPFARSLTGTADRQRIARVQQHQRRVPSPCKAKNATPIADKIESEPQPSTLVAALDGNLCTIDVRLLRRHDGCPLWTTVDFNIAMTAIERSRAWFQISSLMQLCCANWKLAMRSNTSWLQGQGSRRSRGLDLCSPRRAACGSKATLDRVMLPCTVMTCMVDISMTASDFDIESSPVPPPTFAQPQT